MPAKGKQTEGLAYIGLGAGLAALLLVAAVSYWSIFGLREDFLWVSHTQEVLRHLSDALGHLTDAETGQRGYLITGEERYLEPYRQAESLFLGGKVCPHIVALRELTRDNPAQQQRLNTLERLSRERLASLAKAIALRREKGPEAAQARILTDAGKRIMDDIRNVITEMREEEQRLLHRHQSQQAARMRFVFMVMGAALLMIPLISAFVIWKIKRDASRRKRATERIEHLNAVLRAVRDINQLIVRETDRDTLLKGACEALVRTRGYHCAWIALLDESGALQAWAQAGLGEAFEPMARRLEAGRLPRCGQTALAQPGVVVVEDPALACSDCPLSASCSDRAGVAVRLAHGGKVFGLLAVSMAIRFAADEEAKDFLEEVAEDVAFALHDLELAAAQQRAQEEIENLAKFLSEDPYPVLRIADDGTTLYANAAATALLADSNCAVGGPAPEPWRQLSRRVLATGLPDALEEPHGQHTVLFSATPVADKGYVNVYGVDITGRKRAEEERARLIAELEQKNAELERFAYTVSHDLKGPLITIKGFAGLLEKGIAEGSMEQVHEDLRRISGAADRMHQLLDELLDLSRVGRVVGPSEDVPLSHLAREAMELMALRVGESGVEIHIPPDLPVVRGDRPRLLSVMQNLMDNAVKFMGDQPEPRVEIGGRQDGNETLCYVRDNGIGIDPKYHDRVFGLFDQLHQGTSEGTGIGLAITKRVVEVHGGRIWVESKGEGHGSTFCFALPRKGESANGEEG